MKEFTLATFVLLSGLVACSTSDEHAGHDHGPGGHDESTESAAKDDHMAPHGGQLLELGDHAGHVEVIYEEAKGTLKLYIYGEDASTPLAVERTPEIKVSSESGGLVIATTMVNATAGKASEFTTADGALKGIDLHGRLTIYVGDKVYNPTLEHEGDEHDGDEGHVEDHDEAEGHDDDHAHGDDADHED